MNDKEAREGFESYMNKMGFGFSSGDDYGWEIWQAAIKSNYDTLLTLTESLVGALEKLSVITDQYQSTAIARDALAQVKLLMGSE